MLTIMDSKTDVWYRYNTRHVALKVAYLGWDYQGLVVQEDTDQTIEAAMFAALTKTKLIENRYRIYRILLSMVTPICII